jgi:hypothetical protein
MFVNKPGSIKNCPVDQYIGVPDGFVIKLPHAISSSQEHEAKAHEPSAWRPHCFKRATSLLAAALSA